MQFNITHNSDEEIGNSTKYEVLKHYTPHGNYSNHGHTIPVSTPPCNAFILIVTQRIEVVPYQRLHEIQNMENFTRTYTRKNTLQKPTSFPKTQI